MSQAAKIEGAIPPPPKRSASALAFDTLLWGGVILLLIISFRPAEIDKFPQLFTDTEKTQGFAQLFFKPFTDAQLFMSMDWSLFIGKMWQTIQMAMWGTALAIIVAIPLGLLGARNIAPVWIQQPVRRVLDLIRSIPDLVVALIFITAVGLGPFAGVMSIMSRPGRSTESRSGNWSPPISSDRPSRASGGGVPAPPFIGRATPKLGRAPGPICPIPFFLPKALMVTDFPGLCRWQPEAA